MNPNNWQIIVNEAVRASTLPSPPFYQLCPLEKQEFHKPDDFMKHVDLYRTSLNARLVVLSSSLLLLVKSNNGGGCILHGNYCPCGRKLTAIYQGTKHNTYFIDVINGCEEAAFIFAFRPEEDPIAAIEAENKLSVEWFQEQRKNPLFNDIESYIKTYDQDSYARIMSKMKRLIPHYKDKIYSSTIKNRHNYCIPIYWLPDDKELKFHFDMSSIITLEKKELVGDKPLTQPTNTTSEKPEIKWDQKTKLEIIKKFLQTV